MSVAIILLRRLEGNLTPHFGRILYKKTNVPFHQRPQSIAVSQPKRYKIACIIGINMCPKKSNADTFLLGYLERFHWVHRC